MSDIIGFTPVGPDKPKENRLAKISPEDLLIEIGKIVFSEPNEYNYLLEDDPKSYVSTDVSGFEEVYKIQNGFELRNFIAENKSAIFETPGLREAVMAKISFLKTTTPQGSTEHALIVMLYEMFNT